MNTLEEVDAEIAEILDIPIEDFQDKRRRNRRLRYLRLKKARIKGNHTAEEWESLLEEFDQRCVRCGEAGGWIHKDHIQPVIFDGSNAIENIQPLCESCNSSKGTDTFNWKEFRREHGWAGTL